MISKTGNSVNSTSSKGSNVSQKAVEPNSVKPSGKRKQSIYLLSQPAILEKQNKLTEQVTNILRDFTDLKPITINSSYSIAKTAVEMRKPGSQVMDPRFRLVERRAFSEPNERVFAIQPDWGYHQSLSIDPAIYMAFEENEKGEWQYKAGCKFEKQAESLKRGHNFGAGPVFVLNLSDELKRISKNPQHGIKLELDPDLQARIIGLLKEGGLLETTKARQLP